MHSHARLDSPPPLTAGKQCKGHPLVLNLFEAGKLVLHSPEYWSRYLEAPKRVGSPCLHMCTSRWHCCETGNADVTGTLLDMCTDCNRQEVFQDQCPVCQRTYSYDHFTSVSNTSLSICFENTHLWYHAILWKPQKRDQDFSFIFVLHVSEIMKAKIQRSFLRLALSVCAGVCGWCFTQMRTQLWTVRIDLSHQQLQQMAAFLFILINNRQTETKTYIP